MSWYKIYPKEKLESIFVEDFHGYIGKKGNWYDKVHGDIILGKKE